MKRVESISAIGRLQSVEDDRYRDLIRELENDSLAE